MRRELKEEEYFYLKSGNVLKSIEELYDKIGSLLDEDFFFHVNDGKNDFANWIRNIFQEEELATKLFAVKTKYEIKSILERHLHFSKKSDDDKILKKESLDVEEPLPVIVSSRPDIPEEDFEEEKRKTVLKKSKMRKKPEVSEEESSENVVVKEKTFSHKHKVIDSEKLNKQTIHKDKQHFLSRIWLKLKASRLFGKLLFNKTYVDNQIKELDTEIEEFRNDVNEELGHDE
ncbi:MAG: hypothetical protein KKF65_06020 [Nanoarchaeota archaeon]|nr:hypothetical protein [Nanoarchaeota archaeon]